MTAFGIQANFKTPAGGLHNIQGDSPEEWFENLEAFREKLDFILGLEAEIQEKARDLAPGSGAAAAVNVLGATTVTAEPMATLNPAYAGADGPTETITDKWGNDWEYNNPAAPPTPRGPAVKKTATSQGGNRYSKWMDPAKGPRWFSQRLPKVPDHEITVFEGFAR